jgi:hypothetical protein
MKKIIISSILIFFFASFNLFSQSAITITSDREDVRFTVVLNGEPVTNFFETWVRITNLPAGFLGVTLVFEHDSIADYFKNIRCKDNEESIWEIVEKKNIRKVVNKTGREVGEKLDIGEHDDTFAYLQDIYQIKQLSKIPYAKGDEEGIEVSTEKSISTSILPIKKSKH